MSRIALVLPPDGLMIRDGKLRELALLKPIDSKSVDGNGAFSIFDEFRHDPADDRAQLKAMRREADVSATHGNNVFFSCAW